MSNNYKDKVWEQYSKLPYPPRNPDDEKNRLIRADLANLLLVNHIFWRGQKKFTKSFRVLDAGCGTGDSTIYLAEQLKNSPAEIVALDMSKQSLAIAKQRARVRNLDNIQFIEESLLNVADLNLGKFDYIVSCGVLHHLEDPEAGIKALSSCLKEDGGMGLMVYAKYGRNAVYMMQDLMKTINSDDEDNKLKNTKTILKSLRPVHWFSLINKSDITKGDAAIYDLLLHSRDRAYTVSELYDFVGSANLKVQRFMAPALYEPDVYLGNPESADLLQSIKNKPIIERQTIAELLNSRMAKHTFFVTGENNVIADADTQSVDVIPVYTLEGFPEKLQLQNDAINIAIGPWTIRFPLNPAKKAILGHIDGTRSLKVIINDAAIETGDSTDSMLACWKDLYKSFDLSDLIRLNNH